MSITEEPTNNWLDNELKTANENNPTGERLESLKLEENKIVEIEIDFSKAFEKWQDPESKAVKKIIPCMHEGKRKAFWLNCANPVYKEILTLGKAGQRKFNILRTGQAKSTRYSLIKK